MIHNPNSVTSRQLTQPEQDALGSVATLLAEVEDLLTDLTLSNTAETHLSSRIRLLAARSLLSDLTKLRPMLDRMASSAPVLIGRIGEDFDTDGDGAILR